MGKRRITLLFLALLIACPLAGCSRKKEYEDLSREQARVIANLNQEVSRLQDDLNRLKESKGDLERAKAELESKLKQELADGGLSLAMGERGLVVTVLDRVLFDSGKAELKESAKLTLEKVSGVLKSRVPMHLVYVEGHTDNDPIRYSGWRSNWELSTARATEVIHYFIESQGVRAERMIATGFGEYHPVASNETLEGKARNRRVEIVISPKKLTEFGTQPIVRT